MTLNRWFQKNANRPLALASVSIALVWLVLFFGLVNEISYRQNEAVRQLANLLSLSFSQQNRVLTEALLDSSHVGLGSQFAIVCEGGKAIITSSTDNGNCLQPTSWLYPRLSYVIPGSSKFNLAVTFFKFGDRTSVWQFFLISLFFIVGCYALLYRIKRRFLKDIFEPFQTGIFGESPMAIEEFEQVRLKRKIIEESKEREAVLQAVLENRSKVAHNIKSPLRTLRIVQESIAETILAKDSKLLSGAIEAINNILGEQQTTAPPSPLQPPMREGKDAILLADFLEDTMAQKSAEYFGLKNVTITLAITAVPFDTFVSVVRHEFHAILSNLVNNSIDAIGNGQGWIRISSELMANGFVRIQIHDNGCGMSEDQRQKIFEKGITFKHKGTGYGLFHARKYLANWGGRIECRYSDPGVGTVFEIQLPVTMPPTWFADRIAVLSKKNILILDDDILIHKVLGERIGSLIDPLKTKIHFAKNESEFEMCLDKIGVEISDSAILCDHELFGQNKTGLDIVRSYGVTTLTTLVTNNFHNTVLINECLNENIRILPKPCIHYAPITSG